MAFVRTAFSGRFLRSSLNAFPTANQCRFSQNLPHASSGMPGMPKEEEMLRRLYAREVLPKATNNPTVRPLNRRFGLVFCQSGYITEKNAAAMKIVIKRYMGGAGLVNHLVHNIQVTRKSPGKRMGGGKGKKAYKVAHVRPNRLAYEWDHPDRIRSEEFARRLRYICPLRVKLVVNDLPKFDDLLEKLKMNVPVCLEAFKETRKAMLKEATKRNFKPKGPTVF